MVYLQPVVRVSGAANGSIVPFAYDPVTTTVPIVEASLDGGLPMRFLFDTGFNSAVILDTRAAKRLGLILNSDRHETYNSSLPSSSALVHQLVLRGRTQADNLTVDLARASVLDLGFVRDATIGSPVDGVIGAGILCDTAVRFNYHTKTLTFFTQPLPDIVPAGATVLPLTERDQDNAYFVNQAPSLGAAIPLLVDSGSEGTNLPLEALATLHPHAYHVNQATMLSSVSLVNDLYLSHFTLGAMIVPHTAVSVEATETSSTAWDPGTLGENILSRYQVTLDPPHSRLLLEPPAMPNFNYSWVGLFLHKVGSGIQVRKVQPGTPAARTGVKSGDRILRVDGYSLQNMAPMLAQLLVNGAAGTVGVFQFQRGTAPPRTVRLARLAEAYVDPPALDGLIGRRDQAHPLVIKAVLPASAAESAGLHAGDSITTINGMVTATMTNAQWQDILYEPRLALTVRAAGSPAVRTLVLQGHAPVSPHQTPLQGTAAPVR